MPEHEKQPRDEYLRQLGHDVRHCLHAIGMGTEVLKTTRNNDAQFAEICELIDKERKTTMKLLGELLDAAVEGNKDNDTVGP